MPLSLDLVTDPGITFSAASALQQCITYAGDHEPRAPSGAWALTVRLTTDEAISQIHAQFFGEESPTDVISFPSGDPLTAASGYLGDIVISVDTAREQAATAGHSIEREIAFLALHGLLHLCGYDDPDESARAAMFRRQTELLEGFEQESGRLW